MVKSFAFLLVFVAPLAQAMEVPNNSQARDQLQIALMQRFLDDAVEKITTLEEKVAQLEAERATIPVATQKNIDSNYPASQLTEVKPLKAKNIPLVSFTNEQRIHKQKIIKNCLFISGSIATIAIAVYFLTGYNVTKTNVSI